MCLFVVVVAILCVCLLWWLHFCVSVCCGGCTFVCLFILVVALFSVSESVAARRAVLHTGSRSYSKCPYSLCAVLYFKNRTE